METSYAHHENFALSLLIGGFILSSLAFRDLGNTLLRSRYLTLPVSTFERFFCMWLLTAIGWIIVFTAIFSAYTALANMVGRLLFADINFLPFNPFGEFAISSMKYYFVTQGIFLVGAAHFKGHVFPKTLFALISFTAICGIIAYFIMSDIIFSDHVCTGDECELVVALGTNTGWMIMKGSSGGRLPQFAG